MSDSELLNLYSARILALAADIPHHGRLAAPQGTARRRSALCGSTVTVDVVVHDGCVVAFGQDVRACALGQAAAAVLGAAVLGRTLPELQAAQFQLQAMLKTAGPAPEAPFAGFEVLLPAREYKNRHASILLALEAVCEAVADAAAQKKPPHVG